MKTVIAIIDNDENDLKALQKMFNIEERKKLFDEYASLNKTMQDSEYNAIVNDIDFRYYKIEYNRGFNYYETIDNNSCVFKLQHAWKFSDFFTKLKNDLHTYSTENILFCVDVLLEQDPQNINPGVQVLNSIKNYQDYFKKSKFVFMSQARYSKENNSILKKYSGNDLVAKPEIVVDAAICRKNDGAILSNAGTEGFIHFLLTKQTMYYNFMSNIFRQLLDC